MRKIAPLAPLGVATFGLGYGLKEAGLPSSYLFAALLVIFLYILVLEAVSPQRKDTSLA